MNKIFIFLLFLSFQALSQKKYGFDNAGIVNSFREINSRCNNSGTLLIDEHSNKYYCNTFKNYIVFGTDTLKTPYTNFYNYANGFLIAQIDSQNHYVRCAKILQGDSIWSTCIQYYKNNIYLAISYSDKIQLAQDTIFSKGATDVCILKFDLNFQLVNYINIGNYRGEFMQNAGLKIKNGHIYFALGYNGGDTTNTVFDHYSLVLGNDTLLCDTSIMNSQSEYAICEMDTNLQILQTASMGGQKDNYCISFDIGNNGIYILGYSNSYSNNNVGGLFFSSANVVDYYIAKLDFQFNGMWVRRIYSLGSPVLNIQSLYVLENNILFTGSNPQSSGCGGSLSNAISFELGASLGPSTGYGYLEFICSYDTNGSFQWARDFNNQISINPPFADAFANRLLMGNQFKYNELVNGVPIAPCNQTDATVDEYDLATGTKKHIASLCGSEFEYNLSLFQDPFGKIYTLGYTTSDQIITANTTCYSTQFIPACFYASLDSCVFYPNSVSNQVSNESISVVPNPSNGVFNITLPEITQTCQLNITDMQGKSLYTNRYSSTFSHSPTTVCLPTLPAGNYILRITDASHSFVKKITIE